MKDNPWKLAYEKAMKNLLKLQNDFLEHRLYYEVGSMVDGIIRANQILIKLKPTEPKPRSTYGKKK